MQIKLSAIKDKQFSINRRGRRDLDEKNAKILGLLKEQHSYNNDQVGMDYLKIKNKQLKSAYSDHE